jgi:hypothetical protein
VQDPHSAFIQSPELFRLYLQALVQTSQFSAVQPAVRRRDAILAAQHLSPPSLPPPEPLSPSQEIARSVLSADAATAKNGPGLGNKSSGAAARNALLGASGIKGNPLHVIVEES